MFMIRSAMPYSTVCAEKNIAPSLETTDSSRRKGDVGICQKYVCIRNHIMYNFCVSLPKRYAVASPISTNALPYDTDIRSLICSAVLLRTTCPAERGAEGVDQGCVGDTQDVLIAAYTMCEIGY